MRILVITAQFPYPPTSGFDSRVYQLARHLAQRHRVSMLSYAWPSQRAAAEQLAREMDVRVVEHPRRSQVARRAGQVRSLFSRRPYCCAEVYSEAMQRAIDEMCAATHFDIIQLETSILSAFRFPAGTRLVLDEHNIEYEVFERMSEGERTWTRRTFNRIEAGRFRRFEQAAWEQVDACAVTSEREVPVIRAQARRLPIAVVPNGVDTAHFLPAAEPPAPRTVVFNGAMRYRPNVDAAHYLIDEIWPIVLESCPTARLTVVGRDAVAVLRRARQPGVEIVDTVPDVRPYLANAAVVAVPVRIGGGTRLKVVEGLSMAKPIVTTSLGCEGIDARDGEHLLVADTERAFASSILRLFDDPELSSSLARSAREMAERRYSWKLAGSRLEALHAEVADRGETSTSSRRRLALAPAANAVGRR